MIKKLTRGENHACTGAKTDGRRTGTLAAPAHHHAVAVLQKCAALAVGKLQAINTAGEWKSPAKAGL